MVERLERYKSVIDAVLEQSKTQAMNIGKTQDAIEIRICLEDLREDKHLLIPAQLIAFAEALKGKKVRAVSFGNVLDQRRNAHGGIATLRVETD